MIAHVRVFGFLNRYVFVSGDYVLSPFPCRLLYWTSGHPVYQWYAYTIIRNQLTVYRGHHIPPVTYVQQVSVSGYVVSGEG